MGDVVNLNKFRKQKTNSQADKLAKQNREKFGRTKQQKENETLAANKRQKNLSGKKIVKPIPKNIPPTDES